MKKLKLTTVLMVLLSLITIQETFSQTDFIPGYYIINSGATYAIAMPSSLDFFKLDDESYTWSYPDISELYMAAGEVVIAFEYAGGKVYCFDPNGRMVVFNGLNSLTKAPMVPGAGIGYMVETIELIDGSELSEGAYYWIIGQNVANSTIKIQVANGKTYDIPQSKIVLYSTYIKRMMKTETYKTVEE